MPAMSHSIIGPDAEQIAEWLKVLVAPDSTAELRVLYASGPAHVQHYESTDLLRMAKDAVRLGKDAKGVYWLMNPLPVEWCGSPSKDGDIVRRHWLLIDCDPKRKGTVSATDSEKEAARQKMIEVDAFLADRGWPAPISTDSGNGWHLLYLIDLPADDGGLVHRVLKRLAKLFDDAEVSIDTKVGNASRICKLPGTVSRKGEHTAERPHRVSRIISIPNQLDVVPIDMLEKLAGEGDNPLPMMTGQPDPVPAADRVSRPEAIEQASLYLAKMDASIEGQNGHDKLLRAASVMVNDYDLTNGEALDLLLSEFNPRCLPPWDEHDIQRKIDEARKNPPHRPAKGPGTGSTAGSSPDASRRAKDRQADTTTEAIVVRLSDVVEQQVEWLWPNRIPLGKLTLLGGDPGLGKSFVTVDMAARVSTGRGWPDCYDQDQPVGSVLMFNCEDDLADTILPRLNRAGGDPRKVIALQGVSVTDPHTGAVRQRGFTLDEDLPKLIGVLESNRDVRLVVIDPVSAYCGERDSHKNADIRAMLAPMSDMASKYRVAVVMVTHLSKGSGGKAVYRAMGSLAFAAAARAVWNVCKDHDDDQRRLILLVKMNVSQEASGLAYRLIDGAVSWEEKPVTMTADDHLAKEAQTDRKPNTNREQGEAVQRAGEWLIEKLTGCSMQAKIVRQMAEDADISTSTLKRAKGLAKVMSQRIGFGEKSVVWWALPEPQSGPLIADVDASEAARLFP